MAKINLLPWRETLRKERQKEFMTLLGFGAAIAVVLVLLTHFQINNMINGQERRNQFLTNEIKILDEKIKEIKKLDSTRQALLERMEVIQNLQATRPEIVHLFDELVTTLPDGVHLTKLEQKGVKITIGGRAESNARVSSYMRNIEGSEWIDKPALDIIATELANGLRISEFSLRAEHASPDDDDEDSES